MGNHKPSLFKRLSSMLVVLLILGLGVAFFATQIHQQFFKTHPANDEGIAERIAPVGAVFAGTTGAAQQQLAARLAAEAAKSQVAYGGTTDGEVIYNNLCTGCHTSGAGGAPVMMRSQWSARLAQGNDVLYQHALEGFTGAAGVMPARGGNPALSDEQVMATVDWMIANLK